jgi:hypothetical protein
MEIVDIIDKVTTIYGDCKEFAPPYEDSRHSGRTLGLNRIEEVRGPNPPQVHSLTPKYGDYCFFRSYGWVIDSIGQAVVRSWVRPLQLNHCYQIVHLISHSCLTVQTFPGYGGLSSELLQTLGLS